MLDDAGAPSVVEFVGPNAVEVGEHDAMFEPVLMNVSGVGHD